MTMIIMIINSNVRGTELDKVSDKLRKTYLLNHFIQNNNVHRPS